MKRSLILLPLFLPAIAHADTETVSRRPNITIYSLKSERKLSEVASSVTVVDREQIDRENKSSVVELLRQVPGVTLANSGGQGQTTRVFLRGTNSNHVLVLIDGMVVNDPSDPATAFDLSNITTDNLEQIEILRGPQSTLYGSQAMGGVINIITRKGEGAPKYTGLAEYGRYNSSRLQAGTNGVVGDTRYSFSAGTTNTDGVSLFTKEYGGKEKDGSRSYTLSGDIASKLTQRFTAKLNARYNRVDSDLDSPGSIPNFGARPDDDLYANADSRQLNARVAGEYSMYGGKWVQELGLSTVDVGRNYITEYFDAFFTPYFGAQHYDGRRDTIDWVHKLKLLDGHTTTLGLEAYSDHFKSSSVREQNVDNHAIYADDQWNITDSFFVNYGARLDDHQSFGREFTWKIAPGYNIKSTGTRLKASYGTGFKAPSLSQLFDPVSGNSGLAPERSKGWDAGFEQSLLGDKLTFGTTIFRNQISDLIGFGPSPLFLTLNVGKARTEGVETNIAVKPIKALSLNFAHTYTRAENEKNNNDLLRRPKHQFLAGTVYQYDEKGDVGINARYVSTRRDFHYITSTLTTLPGYGVVDLVTNYKVHANATVYARLDNVLDKRYQEISGYGAPGRGLYVGVKTTY